MCWCTHYDSPTCGHSWISMTHACGFCRDFLNCLNHQIIQVLIAPAYVCPRCNCGFSDPETIKMIAGPWGCNQMIRGHWGGNQVIPGQWGNAQLHPNNWGAQPMMPGNWGGNQALPGQWGNAQPAQPMMPGNWGGNQQQLGGNVPCVGNELVPSPGMGGGNQMAPGRNAPLLGNEIIGSPFMGGGPALVDNGWDDPMMGRFGGFGGWERRRHRRRDSWYREYRRTSHPRVGCTVM